MIMKNTFKQTGLLILVLLFSFGKSATAKAQKSSQEFTYVKIEVRGLACPFCAYGLEKKLKEVEGVETIKIDVEEGLTFLSILKAQKPTKETFEKIITDAGFTPSGVVFSDKPFKRKDDE
jgi:copper chaperone CopZ